MPDREQKQAAPAMIAWARNFLSKVRKVRGSAQIKFGGILHLAALQSRESINGHAMGRVL
jgi:hypothetical protein